MKFLHFVHFAGLCTFPGVIFGQSIEAFSSSKPSPVDIVTNHSTTFWDDGFNCIAVIGGIIALISLVVAVITYQAQKKTEQHTSNAPKSAQIGKLQDLPRHFYRNLVCICAMTLNYFDETNRKNGKRVAYPSESNILKLKTLPDEIIYDIDAEEKSYKERHEFKLLLRNYNSEVDVAAEHFSRANISDGAIFQDIDNLIFKQLYLICRSYDILYALVSKSKEKIVEDSLLCILQEHFTKLQNAKIKGKNRMFLPCVNRILKSNDETGIIGCFTQLIDPKSSLERSYDAICKYINKGQWKSNKAQDESNKSNSPQKIISREVINGKSKLVFNKSHFVDYTRHKWETLKKYIGHTCETLERFIYHTWTTLKKFIWNISPIIVKGNTTEDKTRNQTPIIRDNVNDIVIIKKRFIDWVRVELKNNDLADFIETLCLNAATVKVPLQANDLMFTSNYDHIDSYFEFLRNEKWHFKELLYYIVTIDCVLETEHIGMVNFTSLEK